MTARSGKGEGPGASAKSPGRAPKGDRDDRAARQAAALRENLRRRKAQARGRAANDRAKAAGHGASDDAPET